MSIKSILAVTVILFTSRFDSPLAGQTAAYPVELTGAITNLAGEALSGARVRLISSDGLENGTIRTDQYGHFVMSNSVFGPLDLEITQPGYVPYHERLLLRPATSLNLQIAMKPEHPESKVQVRVKVVDQKGNAISTASVDIGFVANQTLTITGSTNGAGIVSQSFQYHGAMFASASAPGSDSNSIVFTTTGSVPPDGKSVELVLSPLVLNND